MFSFPTGMLLPITRINQNMSPSDPSNSQSRTSKSLHIGRFSIFGPSCGFPVEVGSSGGKPQVMARSSVDVELSLKQLQSCQNESGGVINFAMLTTVRQNFIYQTAWMGHKICVSAGIARVLGLLHCILNIMG